VNEQKKKESMARCYISARFLRNCQLQTAEGNTCSPELPSHNKTMLITIRAFDNPI